MIFFILILFLKMLRLKQKPTKSRFYTQFCRQDNYILQASAHLRQASAQALQWAWWWACFSHSVAQASQQATQSLQSSSANCEPLAQSLAHKSQMSAQSRHNKAQVLLPSFIQATVHFSHSVTHTKQAAIQS
jgi:hypothetical protein